MSRPLDRIHDTGRSFARIWFPIWKRDRFGNRRWIARHFTGSLAKRSWFLTDYNGFHNERTGGDA